MPGRRIYTTTLLLLAVMYIHAAHAQKWLWAKPDTYTNYNGSSYPIAATTDASGNVYEAGFYTDSIVFGSYKLGSYSENSYLVKYDKNGNVLWATSPSTSTAYYYYKVSQPTSVCTDASGNVYMAGIFADTITFGPYTLMTGLSTSSGYLVKYNAAGNVLWAKKEGGAESASLAADASSGDIYMSGYYDTTTVIGGYTLANPGTGGSIYLVKYTSAGSVLWVTNATSTPLYYSAMYNLPGLSSLAVDASGNVYLAGPFSGSISFGTQTVSNGGYDNVFLAKFNSSGTALWLTSPTLPSLSSRTDNSPDDGKKSVVTDASGNVYLAGSFFDSIKFGGFLIPETQGYESHIFIAKYNPAGSVIWAQGANDSIFGNAFYLAADKWNNVYISGNFESAMKLGGLSLSSIAYMSAFVIELNSWGQAICGTSVNNSNDDNNALAADPTARNVYFTAYASAPCALGTDSVYSSGYNSYAFMGKWTCNTCNIAPTITSPVTNICNGQSTTLYASGGNYYFWSTGSTNDTITVSPSSPAVYYVTASLDTTCSAKASIFINVTQPPAVTVSDTQVVCRGYSVQLNASGGTTYNWAPPAGLNSTTVANPLAGPVSNTSYTVTVTTGPCTVTDSVLVKVGNAPPISACCDTVIENGQSVQLSASGGGTYLWQPTYGLNCVTCPDPVASPDINTTYTLLVVSDSGCTAEEFITVDVSCGTIFIPDAFSPNNDGHNDVFYVRGDCIQALYLAIYDRWGNKIFETNDKNNGWNGTYKGMPVNTGTYTYYAEVHSYDGTNIQRKGTIALVR